VRNSSIKLDPARRPLTDAYCRVIDADRKSVRYRSARDDDADLRERLRELANQRRWFGKLYPHYASTTPSMLDSDLSYCETFIGRKSRCIL